LARALVRDANILILDDALSSVDTQTEEHILQGLSARLATQTSIIISHRISTVSNADIILVMDEGRIAERGRHDELLALNGLYAQMYQRQLLEEALEEQ
jgi:ATP-binding cassette subfamily B protein